MCAPSVRRSADTGTASNPDSAATIDELETWLRVANERLSELQQLQLQGGTDDIAHQVSILEQAVDQNRQVLASKRKSINEESAETTQLRAELAALRGELDAAQHEVLCVTRQLE